MSATAELLRMPEAPESEFPPLLGNAPYAFVLCQAAGIITAFNPAAVDLLGLKPGNLLASRFVDLVHSEQRAEVEREISAISTGRRDSFRIETRTRGIESRAVRWTVWNVHGEANGFLALVEEAPLASSVEQRLRQAQRLEAIGRLAGGVAHDFNNLLTGVLLCCDLLMASLDPGHKAWKYADEIRKAGFQATGIVRQLLALARPSNEEVRLLCLNEIVEGMRNLLSRLIGENFELTFKLDPDLGLVSMDPSQAQQILLNLVLNSRDAMPQGGQISIETRNCKVQILPDALDGDNTPSLPCALFSVSDNGPGMPESVRTHIFEPFFKTKAGKGTGLGLSTVHDIVTTSAGLIYVDSRLGKGTRVSVLLPLLTPEAKDFSHQSSDPSSYPNHEDVLSSQEKE